MTETWKPVDGWPYEVSDQGRVRRVTDGWNTRPGRLLRHKLNTHGRPALTLSDGVNRRWHTTVHRLVATAFLGEREPGQQVNHINGDRTDNRLANLEYCTAKENCAHAKALDVWPSGDRHGRRKLDSAKVAAIRERYAAGDVTQTELAREFGVRQTLVSMIVNRLIWQ